MSKINTEIKAERVVTDVRDLEGTRIQKSAGFVYDKRKDRIINYIQCYKCLGFTVNIREGLCTICKEKTAKEVVQ